MDNLELALQYARNYWTIIPLHTPQGAGCSCGNPQCSKPGKHPRISEWQKSFCDTDTVEAWWTQWPDANIGLRLDDATVLDVDGAEGAASLQALEAEHGPLDPRARQRSGSGGTHFLFDAVKGMCKQLKFRPGLDLLTGPGCFIVTEPSVHATGGAYAWTHEPSPLSARRDSIKLSAPPQWLLDAVANRKTTKERVPAERVLDAAVKRVKDGASRNDAGLWLFIQLRDNSYSRDECTLHLRAWVERANETAPSTHRYTMEEARATLRSAFSEPARDPWTDSDKESQADILLKLTGDFEYFKTGPANDGIVRMVIGEHREVWPVSAKHPKVREVLTHRYLAQKDRAPGREALSTAVDTVAARCSMATKTDVYVRFARKRDVIYLDLCDDEWRAVEVTKDGWRVVQDPPVLFRRGAGARALPVPTPGGNLDALRPLLNCGDDGQWCLMLAWLVGVFLPQGAFSHLALHGEQGSAKSTTTLILQSLLDPSDAGLNAPPKDEQDATVSALHAGILAYDNLSGCRAEMADVFCRFSTGQGYRTRTFYENLGVTVASVKLPILLNGIDSTVLRGDLLERSITLKLPRITSDMRLTEEGVWDAFTRAHPGALGALLDAVSTGLRNLPYTTLTDAPRMSDFCRWITACEPALPWLPGTFMATYRRKLEDASRDLAESDSVASAVMEWAEHWLRPGNTADLTAKDLLVQLNEVTAGWPKDLKHWPGSPEALAFRLPRLAPILRAHGIEVRRLPRNKKQRSRWEVRRMGPALPLLEAA